MIAAIGLLLLVVFFLAIFFDSTINPHLEIPEDWQAIFGFCGVLGVTLIVIDAALKLWEMFT